MSAYILSVVPLDGHLTSFYYAPPDTVGIEFGTSCLRTVAVNRRCGGEPDGSYLLAGQIVRTKKKIQCKKVQTSKSGLHLLFIADIQRQLLTNPVHRIRRRVVPYP